MSSQAFNAEFEDCRLQLKTSTFRAMLWDEWVKFCGADEELQTEAVPLVTTGSSRKRAAEDAPDAREALVSFIMGERGCTEHEATAPACYDADLMPLFEQGTVR